MTSSTFRSALFVTFIAIFAATAVITLLGIIDVVPIRDGYLKTLFTALILETVGAVIALFRSTSFFGAGTSAELKQITGAWWEFIDGKDNLAVSFVRITHSPKTDSLVLIGDAYGRDGKRAADWTSSNAWLDDASMQVVYLWSGNELATKSSELTGFGVIRFRSRTEAAPADEGFGWFISPAVPTPDAGKRVLVEMRRASETDRTVMLGEDAAAKAQLVTKLLATR
jgi:hypothetical protein